MPQDRNDKKLASMFIVCAVVGVMNLMSPAMIQMNVFFFNDTATTEIYTLSLHDALPMLRHVFAGKFPIPHGDNCLLTASRTFVDLSFSRLLAYQHGVAAPAASAAMLRRTSRTFDHGDCGRNA